MRYQLIGKKTKFFGKPLWEIVGNLKNFGAGRLVKLSTEFAEPCFYRILKVVPLPPPKRQFIDRKVIAWVDTVHRGLLIPKNKISRLTDLPKFQLIPKSEEAKYLKLHEEIQNNFKPAIIPKYTKWPPLYELLWKRRRVYKDKTRIVLPMPKLTTTVQENSLMKVKISEDDRETPLCTTSLYKNDVPVEDMIKEIVQLKKLIKAHASKAAK